MQIKYGLHLNLARDWHKKLRLGQVSGFWGFSDSLIDGEVDVFSVAITSKLSEEGDSNPRPLKDLQGTLESLEHGI